MTGKKFRNISAIALSLAVFAMVSPPADARRGGSVGSRGSRTYVAPPATKTAPKQAAPVQKSMSDKPAANQAGAAAGAAKSGGMSKGLMGGLMGGLLAGGLLGMLMGGGLGALGGSGMLMALLQVALIGGAVFLLMRFLRRRKGATATATPFASAPQTPNVSPFANHNGNNNPFANNQQGGFQQGTVQQGNFGGSAELQAPAMPYTRDIEIDGADKATFERLLTEVQDAYGREDYTILRASTTPEMMSYFAEEISGNATRGLRNNVSGTELLEAEVAEAWNENGSDYATIAMQYQSIDIMLDRHTGAVAEGNPDVATRATELWTFVRTAGSPWRLSAIQEA